MRDKGNGETQKQSLENILKMKRKRIWSICLKVNISLRIWEPREMSEILNFFSLSRYMIERVIKTFFCLCLK